MDGALRASANRAWLLASSDIPIALLAMASRLCAPTAARVIRIGPDDDTAVSGKPAKGAVADISTGRTDESLDQAFVKRLLTSYLNYTPTDVDDHWASGLNMVIRNLRAYTLKGIEDDDS